MTTATRHLGVMGAGFCLPHLFECADGERYVVKFMSNPQGIRGLPNELVAWRLGRMLDLPVVPGRVVELTPALIKSVPALQKLQVEPGPHYGSLYMERAVAPSSMLLAQCANLDKAPGMIVFDHWIQNDDRDTGNILVLPGKHPKFYMIDHESCFCGSGWYDEDLLQHRDLVQPYWSDVYERFVPLIDRRENPFAAALERVEALSLDEIRAAMQGIPAEWEVAPEEFDLLIDYLARRQKLVRHAILQLKHHFPKWSGQRRVMRKARK